MRIIISGEPRTKKNSQRIVTRGNRHFVLPSKAYEDYEVIAGYQIPCKEQKISVPVNVQCVYYMSTHRRVDLVNLIEATCDILVKYGVLADDNSSIIHSHDGSKVLYDKQHPRVEITITQVEAV